MKKVLAIILCVSCMSFIKWESNFEAAKKAAQENHKLILLNFSGSDWCGPCIRLRKEILESEVFTKMADTSLVLVNADFPRNKKNRLSAELTKQNEALADIYNRDGKFPFTLLLDAEGKVIRSWEGVPAKTANEFSYAINNYCLSRK